MVAVAQEVALLVVKHFLQDFLPGYQVVQKDDYFDLIRYEKSYGMVKEFLWSFPRSIESISLYYDFRQRRHQ